jgi:hypothetical protein
MDTPRAKNKSKPPATKKKRSEPARVATETLANAAVPPKARAEYAALLREIEAAEFDEVRGWDRKWEAIATVLDKKYFVLDDEASTAPAWVKKHTSENYRSALRNARVAVVASPQEEKRFKRSKIDLAISIELTRMSAAAQKAKVEFDVKKATQKIALSKLRYTVVRENKKRVVDLEEITPDELRAIAKGNATEDESQRSRLSAQARMVIATINKNAALKNVTLSERDRELTLGKIRFDQLATLGRVLSKITLDDED